MIRAVVILLEKDEKIVFVKRSMLKKSLPGRWSLTSGMVEENESVFETAKREAKEELDVDIFDLELIDEQEIKKDSEHKILYFIRASYKGDLKLVDERETAEIRQYSMKEFFSLFKDEEIGHGLQYLRKKLGY